MSSLSRVLVSSTLLKQGLISSKWIQPVSCMATMKSMTPAEHKIAKENFWDKNNRLKRPLSPHLLIYRPQMTSLLSVTHRGTGGALAAMLIGGAFGGVLLPMPFPEALALVQGFQFGMPIIFCAKLVITWPLCFHLLNGIRHLAWDLGYGFKLPDLHKTGWAVLALSLLGSAGLSCL